MICTITPRTTASPRKTIFALAVLASTAWTPVAFASEFAAVIPLSSLDGVIGFRLDGVGRYDHSSYSVASAGDVNGDGFGDVIVGASYADVDVRGATGSSYLVFGKASGFAATVALSDLNGSNGFRLDGVAANDHSGRSVASAGDVNGDGFVDVIVGAYRADPHGEASGSSYVLFGKAAGFAANIDLASLDGTNGFRLDGAATYDYSGNSVASAGDINGDRFGDIIVGAPGARSSYVVFGKASGFAATTDLSALNGSNGFRLEGGPTHRSAIGSIANAGDVNGDGFSDLIVGAPRADPHGEASGSTYVLFGKAAGFAANIDLASLDGTNGFRLDGVAGYDYSGFAVSGASDVNGDGFADVIIGAPVASSSYVVFGRASGFTASIDLAILDGTNGFRLGGEAAGDFSGVSVASAGDVNGDGFGDVMVGASQTNPHGSNSGSSYVVFGKAAGFAASIGLSSLDGTTGFQLDGVAAFDFSGRSVASAGDVSGDGFADIIVGAWNATSPGQPYSGSSYVVFGRAPDSARTRVGAKGNQYISGGASDDTLKGLGGNDTLEGRGGADNLIGGANKDAASYFHSSAGVKASLATPDSNTGDAAGDEYSSIKNLIGSRFADELTGNGFSNSLTGGIGGDVLTGAGGPDLFIYNALSDSPPGAGRDQITDFDAGTAVTSADKIDLRTIDAKTGPGNQSFTFIGTAAFTNTMGELRVQQAGSSAFVMGDVNGDGAADFKIELLNFADLSTLTAIDFRL